MTQPASRIESADDADRIDPSRAAAGLARWRRAVADALREDPGAALDEPRRALVMLKVFGATRRLADLCHRFPAISARALLDGPSEILAEAARDLSALGTGIGGADALHSALAPIKHRTDVAIALAEIGGGWSAAEAATARTDLAERLVETALAWLVRGVISRGELNAQSPDGCIDGVFALAGGDFAHEDLSPQGPLDLLVVYDGGRYSGPSARMAERAFVKVAADLREAFEGRAGEHPIFGLRAPLGSCINGAGLAESRCRVIACINDPQQEPLRRWFGAARIVAGDRTAGGAFLEELEPAIFAEAATLSDRSRAELMAPSDDPRAPYRALASVMRWSLGRSRPVFRSASTREVITIAAGSGPLRRDQCDRLAAGSDFVDSYVARAQMMKGASFNSAPARADEDEAMAALMGYPDAASLAQVREGVVAEARSALRRVLEGAQTEFGRYRAAERAADDIEKLEDLGFANGAGLAVLVDGWAELCQGEAPARFSTIAPGLLTAFGETQHPDVAARLFDHLLRHRNDANGQVEAIASTRRRDGIIDALGCFGEVVAPLAEDPVLASAFVEDHGVETPNSGGEWLTRHAPPSEGSKIETVAHWRRVSIAQIALHAAAGDMSFGAAADALRSVHEAALKGVFTAVACDQDIDPSHLGLILYDGAARGVPGASTPLGFIAEGGDAARCEETARKVLDAIAALGEGVFAVQPDVAHRPGGVSGPLAPDIKAIKGFIQSEAIALEQLMLARGRIVTGAGPAARHALRLAVANPRRSEILLRDLDRARAQRLRRDRAGSIWDLEQLEGGLADVDLIISTLIYRHAATQPELQSGDPGAALDLLARSSLIGHDVANALKSAHGFWTRLTTARALARWSNPQCAPVRKRFAALLARAAEVENFEAVRPIMRGYADDVTRLYAQLVLGRPSLALVANA